MTRVKICGITNYDDAMAAAGLGADAIGFIFYEKSPRYVSPQTVREIVSSLPPFISTVGVFVNYPFEAIDEIMKAARLDTVQLHGDESIETVAACRKRYRVIKAVRVGVPDDLKMLSGYSVDAFLLDTYSKGLYGGTGERFDPALIDSAKSYGRVIVAGGLNPDNAASIIETYAPYGIDVNSGIESSPGIKDHRLMSLLFERLLRIR